MPATVTKIPACYPICRSWVSRLQTSMPYLSPTCMATISADCSRIAKLYIPDVELDAWTKTSETTPKNVKAMMDAYGENLVKFALTDVLPHGIEALAAYGHTPGHTLYRTGNLLIGGDIMHGVALQVENPEFCAWYDMDKEGAIASRKAILELVKKEGWTLHGMHFPTKEGLKIK